MKHHLHETNHSGTIDENKAGGHGGDLLAASRESGLPPEEILDFSSNVNPLGPPPGLHSHLRRRLKTIINYPEPGAWSLREQLADFLGVDQERLMVGNGANDLLHSLLLWQRPRQVVLPAPTFSEYARAARLAGAEVKQVYQPPGETLQVKEIEKELEEKDWLVLCNPNNPTGRLFPRREIEPLVQAAGQKSASVLVDESFLPLTGREEESLRNAEELNSRLWVLLSLTKLWALPGLRLGCLAGPEKEVQSINSLGDPWRVNTLAREAGLFCLQQEDYLGKTLDLLKKERKYLQRGLERAGKFEVYRGEANFLLIRGVEENFRASDLRSFLIKRGLLIRQADNFYGLDSRYFRLAVRRRRENRRLLQGIEEYLNKHTWSAESE